ncbi:hypothetical protein PORY_000990 [Pneumocystis oryctolagi]|uniref:Uncharacterized protein n=1 Tax=Pneumocystis oryctolagi TaxID=42067 RepID=A0ACB7CID1_9ASCO|nr:hypothetical protein PORY_000990 [Pneumocystis oryctolagi]
MIAPLCTQKATYLMENTAYIPGNSEDLTGVNLDIVEAKVHILRPETYSSGYKPCKQGSEEHLLASFKPVSSSEAPLFDSSTCVVDTSTASEALSNFSMRTPKRKVHFFHDKTRMTEGTMCAFDAPMYTLHSSADYLERQLNQIALTQQDEDHEKYTCKNASTVPPASTPSLLTMLLASPQKTAFPESTSLDLLSDHGSTSGHSTPTPPLLLHFTSRPSIKFSAPLLSQKNAQEFTHELLPILQPPCIQHGFQQDLHTNLTTDRSQHHIRFQAGIIGADGVTGIEKMGVGGGKGTVNASNKPVTKILLDHVLPKEKMNPIMEDKDDNKFEEDIDDDSADEVSSDIETSRKSQMSRRLQILQCCQKEKSKTNHDSAKHHFFESASYQSVITTPCNLLQKYLMSSVDNIDECSGSFPTSSYEKIDFQDDMDLILGRLDEDQFNEIETVSHLHTSTGNSHKIAQCNIDPILSYSSTDESCSSYTSFLEGKLSQYHPSPLLLAKKHNKGFVNRN